VRGLPAAGAVVLMSDDKEEGAWGGIA